MAPDLIQGHESKSEIHRTSILTTQDVLSTLENEEKSTDLIRNKILNQTVSVNLRRQDISIKGHRADLS